MAARKGTAGKKKTSAGRGGSRAASRRAGSKARPSGPGGFGRGAEILGLVGAFALAFLVLCLVSWSLPVLSSPPAPPTAADNWCGAVGHALAGWLLGFLGLGTFVLAGLGLVVSAAALRGAAPPLVLALPGLSAALLGACGLFAYADRLLYPPHYVLPGGGLGVLIHAYLEPALGRVGLALALVLLLLFGLMAATRLSPLACLSGLARLCRRGAGWSREAGRRRRSRAAPRDPGPQADMALLPGPGPGPAAELEAGPPPAVQAGKALEKTTATLESGRQPAVHEPVRREPGPEDEAAFEARPLKKGDYTLPPLNLLERRDQDPDLPEREYYYEVSRRLAAKLADFGVKGEVVGISPGPVVTTYEFAPAPGVKINKIVSLADDVALGLKAESVRIVGSIPGKAALGIEIPNPRRAIVSLREVFAGSAYRDSASPLTLALGLDVVGNPVCADLARMPHLLIAGATGAGKSVCINAFLASILYKAVPAEVRLLLIDPKRIELSVYEDIPHLLHPVVVEPKMAARALQWAVAEMESRYRLLDEKRVKSIDSYNNLAEEKLPRIVVVVDELADLMMVASKEVETSIARLAQMARAAGMHLILATQRPSVDVLTGLIKANFPARISFKVSSKVDSRTIIDGPGAEHLLGAGDMLFLPPGTARLVRVHGAYISEQETEAVCAYLKEQGRAQYDQRVMRQMEEDAAAAAADGGGEEEHDAKYDEAVAVVCETGQASISMIQRRLRIGYNRAARMIETMEREGIVGPAEGVRPREVLVRKGYDDVPEEGEAGP